jgi:hypothetical protein
MSEDPRSPGQIACEAFAAKLAAPTGAMVSSLGVPWSQYSPLGQSAWEAAASSVVSAEMAKLQNPSAVHANMLRGLIAKINIRLWAHAHGIHDAAVVGRLVAVLEEHLDAEKEARRA